MNTILEVSGLCVRSAHDPLAAPILQDVSFDVAEGETLVFLGESGSGKSFLCRSLTRLFLPAERITVSGSVRIAGREFYSLSGEEVRAVRATMVRYVFQDPFGSLIPLLSVRGHFRLFYGAGAVEQRDIPALLRECGLPEPERVLDAYPHELSGGMAQRALIALAVYASPSLLIADEPTSALDASKRFQILDLLQRLTGSAGMSLLLVTHDLTVAGQYGARTAVLLRGRIVELAATDLLFERPLHPYTRLLLNAGSAPSMTLGTDPAGVSGRRRSDYGCVFYGACPKQQDVCATDDPPVVRVEPRHEVRCHFWQ